MRSSTVIIILFYFIITSCSKESIIPDLEGNLVGYVYTFNEFAEVQEDHSGVVVTTIGQNRYTAITDKRGRYEFRKLPAGIYALSFEKAGYGTMKYWGVRHLGGTATVFGFTFSSSEYSRAVFLYRFPKTKILDLSVANDSLYAVFDLGDRQPYWMNLIVYFSDQPGFSADNAQQRVTRALLSENGMYKCVLVRNGAPAIEKGKQTYFKASIYTSTGGINIPEMGNRSISGINTYFDLYLKKTIYPSAGDVSSEYSFILPE